MKMNVSLIPQMLRQQRGRMILCFAALFFTGSIVCVNPVYSQSVTNTPSKEMVVSGKVTDESGQPLNGVSVNVKNSKAGTTTDAA